MRSIRAGIARKHPPKLQPLSKPESLCANGSNLIVPLGPAPRRHSGQFAGDSATGYEVSLIQGGWIDAPSSSQ